MPKTEIPDCDKIAHWEALIEMRDRAATPTLKRYWDNLQYAYWLASDIASWTSERMRDAHLAAYTKRQGK